MALILGTWSAIIEPGKTLSQTTTPAIQITNISFGPEITGNARSVVSIKYPEFDEDDFDDEEDDEEDEDEDDDDSSPIKLPKLVTKEAVIAILKPDATEQVSVNISLVEDVEVVEFSATGPNAIHLVGHYIRQEDFDQEPYDSEFDSDDDDDESIDSDLIDGEDIDEDDMEGISGLIGDSDDDEDDEEDKARFEELKESVKSNPKKRQAEDDDVAASLLKSNDADATLSKNQKKKLAKKLKATDGSAAAPPAPAAAKEEKKEAAPAPKKEGPKPVTLAGGLVILDSKKGDGPVAKSGKKVGVRYIGKLESGKIFDSNTKGAPLTFTLGRGEVIKGWDQGVAGMAVGGERRLTIPAALGYGKKGTQGIPGNATLIFDVKLVSLK
ncbi:hypothetical protein T439DRAFT_382049 [Meredithblackwellia eburnea MCA 4105]